MPNQNPKSGLQPKTPNDPPEPEQSEKASFLKTYIYTASGYRVALLVVIGCAIFLTTRGLQLYIDSFQTGLGFLLAGILFFVLAYYFHLQGTWPHWATAEGTNSIQEQRLYNLITLAASVYLAVQAYNFAGDSPKMPNPIAALSFWLIAIGLAITVTYVPLNKASETSELTSSPMPRWEKLALVLLFIFALLVRVIAIGQLPHELSGDEASIGLNSIQIVKGYFDNPFIAGWYGFPSLFFMFPAVSIALLGQTIAAIRIPAACVGALTVVGLYWMAKPLFGRATAWISAILLSALSFHIHMSRLGLNNIWDGLFIVYVLGLFWRGWYTGKRWYFIGAGLLLGFSQYFYTSGRIMPVILLLWLLCMVITERQRLKERLPDLFSMIFVAGIVFLPLGLYFIAHVDQFMEPLNRVSVVPQIVSTFQTDNLAGWSLLLTNFKRAAFAFTSEPLLSFYTLGRPILPVSLIGLFALGLTLVFLNLRDARYRLLLFWTVSVVAISALSEFPPSGHRYVMGIPLAVLLVAIALTTIQQWLIDVEIINIWPAIRKWSFVVIAAGLITVMSMELHFYFVEYAASTSSFYERDGRVDFNTTVAMRLVLYMKDYPSNTQVIFFGPTRMWYDGWPQFTYLAPQVQGLSVEQGNSPESVISPNAYQHMLFVFLPERQPEAPSIEQHYPGGVSRWIDDQNGNHLFYVYETTSQ